MKHLIGFLHVIFTMVGVVVGAVVGFSKTGYDMGVEAAEDMIKDSEDV